MKYSYLLLICALLAVGCSHKSNVYIIGGPQLYEDFDGYTDIIILSDPVSDTAWVTLNNAAVPRIVGGIGFPPYALVFEADNLPVAGLEYAMEFGTDGAEGSATCFVPQSFVITAPESVAVNDQLAVTWNKSDHAVWFSVQFSFFDTLGSYRDTSLQTEDTTFIVPASWLSTDGWLDLYIDAVNGPTIETGEGGNIEGASGYWLGINSQVTAVMVGHPYGPHPGFKTARDHRSVYRAYLTAAAPYNENAADLLEKLRP